MLINGVDVTPVSKYCFESAHPQCWSKVWWPKSDMVTAGYRTCECACHSGRR